MTSKLQIIDTTAFIKAVAKFHLPINLRIGLHGKCVDSQELGQSNY